MEKGTSEIAKLTERLSKDPKSKLFVPLAEEYKKTGDIETAIAVLVEGLKNNPGYVTAKSFLGRLLLDKGNLTEAQKEFEEVIKAIPDNVLAQRKLGEIHALQGRAQEALQFFKTVLSVNPKDPELNALIADIEAGRDVRGKIAGPKFQPPAGQASAAVPPPKPAPAPATPAPAVKPAEAPAVPQGQKAAPVSIPPSAESEEPEEVLVFESLDEAAPVVPQQPQASHDMFSHLAAEETVQHEAVRMDDGLAGHEGSLPFDTKPATPVPGRSAAVTEQRPSSPDAGSINSFFDSEPVAPMEIPADSSGFDAAAMPELSVPAQEKGPSSPNASPGNRFFDSEVAPLDIPAADSSGFDMAASPELSVPAAELGSGSLDAAPGNSFFDSEPLPSETTVAEPHEPEKSIIPDRSTEWEQVPGTDTAGLSGDDIFGSEPMPAEAQKTEPALDFSQELVHEISVEEPKEAVAADEAPPEALFFDVEPVETEPEPQAGKNAGDESAPAALDLAEAGNESAVLDEVSSDSLLFDVEPAEMEMESVPASSGPELAGKDETAVFGEVLPEADDFTTDTLAELYIAQGFYEKAIEIYERMLADRPNSKLLKDKLAHVRAMGSASGADEEQGTPVFFEAPASPPLTPPPPASPGGTKQRPIPGVEAEAREYVPPPADDFESRAFDSGFAPVEYVLPETAEMVPQPPPPAAPVLPVQGEEMPPAAPKTVVSGKEQTIVRLDNWLKNIMKEK
jgi:tetratricopeptide (TPR) repeat protein